MVNNVRKSAAVPFRPEIVERICAIFDAKRTTIVSRELFRGASINQGLTTQLYIAIPVRNSTRICFKREGEGERERETEISIQNFATRNSVNSGMQFSRLSFPPSYHDSREMR